MRVLEGWEGLEGGEGGTKREGTKREGRVVKKYQGMVKREKGMSKVKG